MHEKSEVLQNLCHALMAELGDYSKKIGKEDGMSAGDLEAVDKLSHALKSVKTTLAMLEVDGSEDGYSGRYMSRSYPVSYDSDGRGSSYAGRRNARRDSMGRYSREGGYSYADGMEELLDEMRDMLPGLSEEKRRRAERLINELQG